MPYRFAGIDVHKKTLAMVVADVEVEGDFHCERHKVGTSPAGLRALAGWLVERQVDEVVMESTAQYWRTAPPADIRPFIASAGGAQAARDGIHGHEEIDEHGIGRIASRVA